MGINTGKLPQLSWPSVLARRLERHALAEPPPGAQPAEVVGAICGAHAQVLAAGELSIGLRIPGITRPAVQDALWSERSLVKTFGPRGTVHLLPARDLPMWTGALSAVPSAPSPLPRDAQLTPEQTDMVVDAIAQALAEAELTADELTWALVERCGAWAGDLVMPAFQGMWPRWRQATHIAANRGALCFGPNRGRTVTYTSPRRWLPGIAPMEGRAALAELVRRYLHAYGPATPQHFAQWLSAPRQWASDLFAALDTTLQMVEVDGLRAWVVAGDTAEGASSPAGVRLLPYFDAYAVGSHPRDWLFPWPVAGRALAGGQAGNFPVLLIDGVVAGVWHQRRSGRRIAITVEPLRDLSAAQHRALEEEVARIGAFFDGSATLAMGAVSVGPHA